MIGASVLLNSKSTSTFSIGGVVTNYAGSGTTGAGIINGTTLLNSTFNQPHGLWFDLSDNLYICDYNNNAIRKITSGGTITTFAGGNTIGAYANGTGTAASFDHPIGIVGIGTNLYVTDSMSSVIRKITSTLASVSFIAGDNVNFTPSYADGTGTAARFAIPCLLTVYNNSLYVADGNNHALRKVTISGSVTNHAGSGGIGHTNNTTASDAKFNFPRGITVDNNGNFYVCDASNHAIRKISSTGEVTTFAGSIAGSATSGSTDGTGTNARFNTPYGIVYNNIDGNLYVTDSGNHKIRKITLNGVVTTIAGNGTQGSTNGTGTSAKFSTPRGIAVHSDGSLYVGDTMNHMIRKIT